MVFLFKSDISGAMQYEGHQEYILILAVIVAIDAFTSIPFAYLRYKNRAMRFSMIKLISVGVNIGLNLLFLLVIPMVSGEKLSTLFVYRSTELIAFVFIANLVSSALSLLLLLPELRKFRMGFDAVLLRQMLGYGLPILVIGLAGMINEVSDKILLRYFLPDASTAQAQIGIYGANYKLAILMMLFIQMFRYAAEPFFFRESGKKDAKATYSKVMTYFVVFTWFIFLGVTLYIDIFKYFIGPDYWVGLYVVPIVLSAKLFLGVFYNLSVWYKLTNKTLYGAFIALIGALVTILMNIILIPRIGYLGSAWANFACYFLMMVISFIWGRKVYRVNYNFKKILIYTLFAVSLFFISLLPVFSKDLYHLLFNSVLMMAYLTVVYLLEKKHVLQ
jgi:O-antigen/teichoic acid export membrane protein